MTATTILKGVITAASALSLAGVVLAQVSTGQPTTGTGIGVTPPPSTSVTTDTSRLTTDCSQVAADARSNQPPHDAMGCNRAPGAAAMGATGTAATVAPSASSGPTASSTTTATTAPDMSAPRKSQKVAKADRG
jgi:hypothetical protein